MEPLTAGTLYRIAWHFERPAPLVIDCRTEARYIGRQDGCELFMAESDTHEQVHGTDAPDQWATWVSTGTTLAIEPESLDAADPLETGE